MTKTTYPALRPGDEAALVISGGQYLLHYWTDAGGAEVVKVISPAAVRAAFANEPIDSGWLSPCVRRWGTGIHGDWVVAHFPPGVYRLPFANDFAPDLPQGVVTIAVPLPGLAALATGSGLHMWALKEEFSPNAALYLAPLPNIGADGKVCLGGNHTPAIRGAVGATQVVAPYFGQIWLTFLDSPFTDHAREGKSRCCPVDVRLGLLALAQRGRRRYPLRDLVPAHMTVNQAIQRHTQ